MNIKNAFRPHENKGYIMELSVTQHNRMRKLRLIRLNQSSRRWQKGIQNASCMPKTTLLY